MHQILKFCSRYLPKNDTFCHIFLDSTLFHQFLAVSVPNIVNVGHFTLIKVRRNSGELKNLPFLVGQSYHPRIAKTQGSSGWNYSAPPMTHREAQNAPKTVNKDKIHQHKAFWSTLEPFIHSWESQNDHFIPKKESYRVATGAQILIKVPTFKLHKDETRNEISLFKIFILTGS